jgi:hypothetical protein
MGGYHKINNRTKKSDVLTLFQNLWEEVVSELCDEILRSHRLALEVSSAHLKIQIPYKIQFQK